MTQKTKSLDTWIRSDFKHMNTELEELYFKNQDSTEVLGENIKKNLLVRAEH